ncbi:hypothetical protein CR513_05340, partial [Mucuna pruriens]
MIHLLNNIFQIWTFIKSFSIDLHYPHGPPHVISQIIKLKFDEPLLSWKKKEYRWDPSQEQTIRVIFEQKGSCIYKNTMNKIRNGHDRATWIPPNRSINKANRAINKGASAYCGGSISTSAHYEKMSKNLPRREQHLQMTSILYRSMIMTYIYKLLEIRMKKGMHVNGTTNGIDA